MRGGRRRPLGPRGRGGAGVGGGRRPHSPRRSAGGGRGQRRRRDWRPAHGPRPAALWPAAAGGARWPLTGAAGSWGCGCWRRRGCAAEWRRASPPAATKCGRRFSCGRSGPSSWSPTCPRPVSTDPPAGWLLRAGGCRGARVAAGGSGPGVRAGRARLCLRPRGSGGSPRAAAARGPPSAPVPTVGGCAPACEKPVRRGSLHPAPAFLPDAGSGN